MPRRLKGRRVLRGRAKHEPRGAMRSHPSGAGAPALRERKSRLSNPAQHLRAHRQGARVISVGHA
eukprot:224161-Pyramimonas_sp.AAC.1